MRLRLVVVLALAAILATVSNAQLSKPIAHDHAVTKGEDGEAAFNKFLERKASPDSFDDEEALHPQDECPANLELRWMTEVTSSIYSTPIITDLFSDGHKEVVVPSFVHYLEVLEGEDGAKAGGDWPAFHKSTVHASPLVHDTGDGTEILLPMYDGEVHFYNDHGAYACVRACGIIKKGVFGRVCTFARPLRERGSRSLFFPSICDHSVPLSKARHPNPKKKRAKSA